MATTLLELKKISKYYEKGKQIIKAVDGIDLELNKGETLGLVGESGCGKSTTGRLILRLIEPTSGQILFDGKDITTSNKRDLLMFRKNAQIIFQDCYASLSPRFKAGDLITEVLQIHNVGANAKDRWEIAREVFEEVSLDEEAMKKYPHEFSGGQRQRIGIARAICLNPKMIICDESVSALDVSVQAQIINLMQKIQHEKGMAYVFISHDLSIVKHISDRIAVMYLGKIVETASKQVFYNNPIHPYSQALLSAIPIPNPTIKKERIVIPPEVNTTQYSDGCRFCQRCWKAQQICHEQTPELVEVYPGHKVACHFAKE